MEERIPSFRSRKPSSHERKPSSHEKEIILIWKKTIRTWKKTNHACINYTVRTWKQRILTLRKIILIRTEKMPPHLSKWNKHLHIQENDLYMRAFAKGRKCMHSKKNSIKINIKSIIAFCTRFFSLQKRLQRKEGWFLRPIRDYR